MHYLELDQFVSERFLVTVHGPLNPRVPMEKALAETNAVIRRLEAGRLKPSSPFALMYAIVTAVVLKEETMVAELAREVGDLEQRVMAGAEEQPEEFLTALFTARHDLLTVRTMAAQAAQIYGRAISLAGFASKESQRLMQDLLDQYERMSRISGSGQAPGLVVIIDAAAHGVRLMARFVTRDSCLSRANRPMRTAA